MKKVTLMITLIFSVFLMSNVSAQEGVSKAELLGALNGVNDLGLSKDKSSELSNYNSGLVDNIFDITDSSKSDDEKVLELKNLRNGTRNDLTNILGEDTFKKYKKSAKKLLKPMKRKMKLFKFVL